MAKRQRATERVDRLPNAPLAEVVFEIRWQLQGNPPFLSDPGILPLTAAFTPRAARMGFSAWKDMARPEETFGHGVTRRYFPTPDVSFPLIQIGPGVFASNQSTEYSWPSFRSQALKASNAFLASYPTLEGYPFVPVHLELRYIDVFDQSLLGTLDLIEFINRGTNMSLSLPEMLSDKKLFSGASEGRVVLAKETRGGMKFVVDLASGKRVDGADILRLETKLVTEQPGIPKFRTRERFAENLEKWLHEAHELTSPFFKRFLTPNVMEKFN